MALEVMQAWVTGVGAPIGLPRECGSGVRATYAYRQLIRGCLLERAGEFQGAAREYHEGLKVCECDGEVTYFLHNNLGYCFNQLGRPREAEEYCRKAIALDPERHNAHKNLGVALAGLGRPEEAARSLLIAVEICPSDPRALLHLRGLLKERPETSRVLLEAAAKPAALDSLDGAAVN